jgi:hypothetical protein
MAPIGLEFNHFVDMSGSNKCVQKSSDSQWPLLTSMLEMRAILFMSLRKMFSR